MTDTASPAPHGLYTPQEIYELLPAVYRIRDVEQGGSLRDLIEVICHEVNAVAEGIEQFYDDQFIETCAEWVAPYIGDLIGYRTLHGDVPGVASPRAEVADTIAFRRRKGTASMLEQLARTVTKWPARATEMFELLTTTQYMKHVRPHAPGVVDLRGADRLALGDPFQAGAFDSSCHTAEMRRIETRGGRYNIANVAIHLWRVAPLEVTRSPLVPVDQPPEAALRYRFDPLGCDSQLFAKPGIETEITHIAEPFDVPLPLGVGWTASHLDEYYGPDRSILLFDEPAPGADLVPVLNDDPTDPAVCVCDLSDDPANPGRWNNEPDAGDPIAIDPQLGRVAYPAAPAGGTSRLATFHRGSAFEIGGGGYSRSIIDRPGATVDQTSLGGHLGAALDAVRTGGTAEIVDCRRYRLPATVEVDPPSDPQANPHTVLRAANRMRPHLSTTTANQVRLDISADATMVLDGLLIEGVPLVIDEQPDAAERTLVIRHSTLVPGLERTPEGNAANLGRASLIVLHPFARIVIDSSIVGPIVAVEGTEVVVTNSVIDAGGQDEVAFCGRAGPGGGALRTVSTAADRQTGDGTTAAGHLDMVTSTVIGRVHADRLDVSNSIILAASLSPADPWPAPLWAERRQVGCIRFSFVPTPTRSPRRHQCVPRSGIPPAAVPRHTSLRFGDPGYAQLRPSTHPAVREGADDESSMGVTHDLYEPQRLANLRIRLDEYLRFGLHAGFFHAS